MRSITSRPGSTTARLRRACASPPSLTVPVSIARTAPPISAGTLGTLCQGWQQAGEPDKPLATKIAAACEDKPFYGKPSIAKRRAPSQRRLLPQNFPFGGPF